MMAAVRFRASSLSWPGDPLARLRRRRPTGRNPEDRESVIVPRDMVRKNSYALRVRGHSMTDDQIQDGDIIIVEKRQTAENGETVVALIKGEQVTLKRFYVEPDGIRLQPANPEMDPIYLRHDEIEILGIVSGVVRMTD